MSRFKIAVGVAISVGLLGYLLWTVDRRELAIQLGRTHLGWVALGSLFGLLGLVARAMRWRYLFPRDDPPPGLVPALMIGYMANNVLPLRAGELVRVYVVARRWGRGFWTTVGTLVVERVLDSLSLVLILGVLVLMIPVPPLFQWAAVILFLIDVVGLAILAYLLAAPDRFRRWLALLGRRWPALERKSLRVYDTFMRGLDGIRTPAHIAPVMALTVVVWILPALAAWVTLIAFDMRLPWLAGWTVLAFVALGISVPSAPGYLGVFDVAAKSAVQIFGIADSSSLGYALVFHASQLVPVTVVGWIYLVREHVSLREARRVPPSLEEPASR